MAGSPKKKVSDKSLFKELAPRMMRNLMRDFSPLATFQAAGAVGNGGEESAGFTQIQEKNPTVKGSKGGLGYFQWTGMGSPAKPGRRRIFETLLKEMGLPPNNFDANYEMLKRELKAPEKVAIIALRKTKDLEEATEVFMSRYLRPGIPHLPERVRFAKIALTAFEAEEAKIAKDPPSV